MAFIDEYRFKARAGKGGDGVVRWRREKFLPKGGPNGGNGGNGGNVVLVGVRDIMRLHRIAHKNQYAAENGEDGGSSSMTGANGKDLIIELPIGSIVTNVLTGEVHELLSEQDRIVLLTGGVGGKGNEHFKSSTNVAPNHATNGQPGESGEFSVELRLIADIGLIGLPNAGKTSLLNTLTNAGAKVGDYPFTTLDPNLGMYHTYIIADIPGIIEGASQGKGLGDKFLRHISRTGIVLHCISCERDTMTDEYTTIRRELVSHPDILKKKEYVIFTKTDTIDAKTLADRIQSFERDTKKEVFASVSILDDASMKMLGDKLVAEIAKSTHQ